MFTVRVVGSFDLKDGNINLKAANMKLGSNQILRETRFDPCLTVLQGAFNEWVNEGGKSLTRVSRILAVTVG